MDVNLLAKSMIVEGDVNPDIVIKAVSDAGFTASLKKKLVDESILEDLESPKIFKRLIISLVFLVLLMYISMGHMLFHFPLPEALYDIKVMGVVQMALSLIIIVINRTFFISGFKGIVRMSPNMDTLVALGSGISFLWSIYVLISGGHEFYFESAAMILVLITVGKLLESISKGKTTDAIKSLVKLMPKTAKVLRDGLEVIIDIDDIVKGDIFIIGPGEAIPVDGIVLNGKTKVDESALTGESVLVDKKEGDTISSGTINQRGSITCTATRVGEDTTLSQIIKLVSDTAASKAPIARFADKVSGIFVPSVITISIITFIAWMINKASLDFSLARAISVLVVSCPCALGLATPVAIMVGSGVSAKHGILFKTAESIEETGRVKVLALDKTGTITNGIAAELIEKGIEDATATDDIRSESIDAVNTFKTMGLKIYMLTGDNENVARKIGNKVGIENVLFGLSPSGKADAVDTIKKYGKTAMVGDGINDAVALTKADVGIAIGAGTDVAIDAASVVLMNSKLSDVALAIKFSKETLKIIHQNLFWAFFYNVLLIPLAAGCYSNVFGITMNPMLGAAAMSLSSIFVVLNALRLNLYNPN